MKHIKREALVQPPGCTKESAQRPKFNFSEYGQVAYQIEGNDNCSNIEAHILSLHTPLTLKVGSKVKTCFFLKIVMLHIKLKGMEHRAPCKHIFYPYTQPVSLGWGQMVKIFLVNVVMLHIKLKSWNIEQHASTHSVLTLYVWGGAKGQNINLKEY